MVVPVSLSFVRALAQIGYPGLKDHDKTLVCSYYFQKAFPHFCVTCLLLADVVVLGTI